MSVRADHKHPSLLHNKCKISRKVIIYIFFSALFATAHATLRASVLIKAALPAETALQGKYNWHCNFFGVLYGTAVDIKGACTIKLFTAVTFAVS
jgi:hypothetical protein